MLGTDIPDRQSSMQGRYLRRGMGLQRLGRAGIRKAREDKWEVSRTHVFKDPGYQKKAPGCFWRPVGEEWHEITFASQKAQCDNL